METHPTGPTGETIDTPRYRALGSDSRAAILRLVRDADDGLTAAEAAEQTGLHLSTVRTHLERLAEADLVVRDRDSGGLPGRPAWRYRAAQAGPAPALYRDLVAALLSNFGKGGKATRVAAAQAGEAWGRQLGARHEGVGEPVESVLAVLDGLGFTPRRLPHTAPGAAEIHLHTCPFLELVDTNPDAMCGLHLGVIRGVLKQTAAPSGGLALEPFGAPHACVVRLPVSRS